jgi:hypothetical protein
MMPSDLDLGGMVGLVSNSFEITVRLRRSHHHAQPLGLSVLCIKTFRMQFVFCGRAHHLLL